MSTPEERLADFRRRHQPYIDALRRGEPPDWRVTLAAMRERFLEVDDISPDKRVDRLVALAEVHRRVDHERAIALYKEALALGPELDHVRHRMQWLEREVARRKGNRPGSSPTGGRQLALVD